MSLRTTRIFVLSILILAFGAPIIQAQEPHWKQEQDPCLAAREARKACSAQNPAPAPTPKVRKRVSIPKTAVPTESSPAEIQLLQQMQESQKAQARAAEAQAKAGEAMANQQEQLWKTLKSFGDGYADAQKKLGEAAMLNAQTNQATQQKDAELKDAQVKLTLLEADPKKGRLALDWYNAHTYRRKVTYDFIVGLAGDVGDPLGRWLGRERVNINTSAMGGAGGSGGAGGNASATGGSATATGGSVGPINVSQNQTQSQTQHQEAHSTATATSSSSSNATATNNNRNDPGSCTGNCRSGDPGGSGNGGKDHDGDGADDDNGHGHNPDPHDPHEH